WRKLSEWRHLNGLSHISALIRSGRIDAVTWSEWHNKIPAERPTINLIGVARCSEFVPPYLDRQFLDFISRFGCAQKECAYCTSPTNQEKRLTGPHDTCVVRSWNDNIPDQYADTALV